MAAVEYSSFSNFVAAFVCTLFFHPTPSWLPPGRYKRSIAKDELRLLCRAVDRR